MRVTCVSIGVVRNHEQVLYGLGDARVAHRIGETHPFHEEVGYWLWHPGERHVVRCFSVPRGMAVMAGGTAEPTTTTFILMAEGGSETYGICSNRFFSREFRTVHHELTVRIFERNRFLYTEDMHLRMPGRPDLFHPTDENTLICAST